MPTPALFKYARALLASLPACDNCLSPIRRLASFCLSSSPHHPPHPPSLSLNLLFPCCAPTTPTQLRDQKDELQKRTDKAEADAATARASAAAAAEVREKTYARQLELQDIISRREQEIASLRTDVLARDAQLAEIDSAFTEMQRRMDASQSATAKAVQHREAALQQIAKLQQLLTEKSDEADGLRSAAVTAQRKESESHRRSKTLEEELAQWHARANTFEHATGDQERTISTLTSQVEALGQQLAERELETSSLREELARRPPIDVIRTLDVENLMQRNMQAAAALQQLLGWQEQQQAQLAATHAGSA